MSERDFASHFDRAKRFSDFVGMYVRMAFCLAGHVALSEAAEKSANIWLEILAFLFLLPAIVLAGFTMDIMSAYFRELFKGRGTFLSLIGRVLPLAAILISFGIYMSLILLLAASRGDLQS